MGRRSLACIFKEQTKDLHPKVVQVNSCVFLSIAPKKIVKKFNSRKQIVLNLLERDYAIKRQDKQFCKSLSDVIKNG